MAISPLEERYATKINTIFSEENKLQKWLAVEVALARAHAKAGNIPKGAADEIAKAVPKVKLSRVKEIEDEIHHDLMAVVKALSEQCSGESGKFVHLGATSYDIEDTATALIFREAIGTIEQSIGSVRSTLKKLALEKKNLVCVGRTHGQYAIPTTYGMKFALYYSEFGRHLQRLDEATKRIEAGKMAGAVGTMAAFGDKGFIIRDAVMKELNLAPATITNQIVQRDRHAEVINDLALISCTLEKIAKEIRNLQRNEIMEIAEPYGRGKQVGSSAMPQKRNPHKSERICSLARVVRSNAQVALENIALEHERDLTNSANERIIFPEAFILTDYMLSQMNSILSGLEFFPENIKRNLESSRGLIMAERLTVTLVEKGMARQDAHELVRQASVKAFDSNKHLRDVVSADQKVTKLLSKSELDKLFDYSTYLGQAMKLVEQAVSE
ncbi:Fumarate hydratase class II [Candidatus Gugararchaeum adminiculabundum]|nr:Fumarate hydratase class II [Candidatus Gugararchaeum adminiculabundum]